MISTCSIEWFSVSRHSKLDRYKKSKPFNRLSPESGNMKEGTYAFDSRQDSGHSNFSHRMIIAKKRFTQIYSRFVWRRLKKCWVPMYMGYQHGGYETSKNICQLSFATNLVNS